MFELIIIAGAAIAVLALILWGRRPDRRSSAGGAEQGFEIGGKMKLLKVLNADMTSPFLGFKFECQKWYHCQDFDNGDAECSNGFYATPIDGLHYAYRPGRRVFVAEVRGQSRIFDCMKQRYEDMMLTDELTADQIKQMAIDAEQRVGYRLSEVLFPVNPLLLPKAIPTDADIIMLKQWASVRDSVWASVWASVSASVWASVSAYVGSLFPNITRWKYAGCFTASGGVIAHEPGIYPFQSAANLWRRGLVPSYDGKQWRLHSGPTAEIVWEEK